MNTPTSHPPPSTPRLVLFCWLAPLLFLWFILLRQLSVEWTLNPQYNYGWTVPFLCAFLAWRHIKQPQPPFSPPLSSRPTLPQLFPFFVLALAYIPTRLILEANPDWRLLSWTLALEVLALSLMAARNLFAQPIPLSPFLLFLTAVPWPTWLQSTLSEHLASTLAFATSELLQLAGACCIAHGHFIELSPGLVDIAEGCSGIRSIQASFMLTLFFVFFYKLSFSPALLCMLCAPAFALFANLLRTLALASLALRSGPFSVDRWHSLLGTAAAFACYAAIWLLASYFRHSQLVPPVAPARRPILARLPSRAIFLHNPSLSLSTSSLSPVPPLLLLSVLILAEIFTHAWFGFHERRLPPPLTWHIDFPPAHPQVRQLPLSAESRLMLRFDDAQNLAWTDTNGLRWQAIFLHWNPGGPAGRLARNHTPSDCLPAAAFTLSDQQTFQTISLHGLELPFRSYRAQTRQGFARVYYCLWEDRSSLRQFEPSYSTCSARLSAVRYGIRNPGQRSLELAVWNALSDREADESLLSVLNTIVHPDP